MNETIELAKNGSTTISFDLNVESGVETNDTKVRFTLLIDEQKSVSFFAKQIQGNTWEVTIPNLNLQELDKNIVYEIEVIINHYYFVPASGNIIFKENEKQISDVKVNISSQPQPQENDSVNVVRENKKQTTTEKTITETKKLTPKESKKDIKNLINEIKNIKPTKTTLSTLIQASALDEQTARFSSLDSLVPTREEKILKIIQKTIKSI